MLKVSIMTNAL